MQRVFHICIRVLFSPVDLPGELRNITFPLSEKCALSIHGAINSQSESFLIFENPSFQIHRVSQNRLVSVPVDIEFRKDIT